MRILKCDEINEVSGGAWWSPSNIFDLVYGADRNTTSKGEWVSPVANIPSPDSSGLAMVIGVGALFLTFAAISAGAQAVVSFITRK